MNTKSFKKFNMKSQCRFCFLAGFLHFRNPLAGWQFLNGLQKQRWQAGFWLHQCVLRNSLAGSKKRFLFPESVLYLSGLRNLAYYIKPFLLSVSLKALFYYLQYSPKVW